MNACFFVYTPSLTMYVKLQTSGDLVTKVAVACCCRAEHRALNISARRVAPRPRAARGGRVAQSIATGVRRGATRSDPRLCWSVSGHREVRRAGRRMVYGRKYRDGNRLTVSRAETRFGLGCCCIRPRRVPPRWF